jgi:hypothetical protein
MDDGCIYSPLYYYFFTTVVFDVIFGNGEAVSWSLYDRASAMVSDD